MRRINSSKPYIDNYYDVRGCTNKCIKYNTCYSNDKDKTYILCYGSDAYEQYYYYISIEEKVANTFKYYLGV